jgi:hypothetical protein
VGVAERELMPRGKLPKDKKEPRATAVAWGFLESVNGRTLLLFGSGDTGSKAHSAVQTFVSNPLPFADFRFRRAALLSRFARMPDPVE